MGGREDGEEIISKWGRADGQDGERIDERVLHGVDQAIANRLPH